MITYHKEIQLVGTNWINIPHQHLSNEIKSFIEDRNVKQDVYSVSANNWYLFIYLSNGDRIDVQK